MENVQIENYKNNVQILDDDQIISTSQDDKFEYLNFIINHRSKQYKYDFFQITNYQNKNFNFFNQNFNNI